MKLLKLSITTLMMLSIAAPLQAFLINLFKPYDMMIRPYVDYATETVQSYVTLECGVNEAKAWNSEGEVASPLAIWM